MERLAFVFFIAVGAVMLVQLPTGQAWPEDCGNNKTHNFFFGKKGYYDKLLYTVQEIKSRSTLRKLSYDIVLPPAGQHPVARITYIEALDQDTDGNGGCVYLSGGGVGFMTATLHMKSQRNKGINFIINVYGA